MVAVDDADVVAVLDPVVVLEDVAELEADDVADEV